MKDYPFEPYKIKVLEPIYLTSREEREQLLRQAYYNLFKVPAEKVVIDLLTDSGTSSLSQNQWSQMIKSDESYASPKSWERFKKSVMEFSGMQEVIPVHQGRAAEKLIAEVLFKKGNVILSNGFFDTTRANLEHHNITCIDIPTKTSADLEKRAFFKGNIDLEKLEELISPQNDKIKAVLMTLTNNTGGGQPASLHNITAAKNLAKSHNLLFIVDACRIAENSYFIGFHEEISSPQDIIRKIFKLADIAYVSAKKDGLSNGGGFMVTNNLPMAEKLRELLLHYEGFTDYGGMTGREMESVAQGLKEVVEFSYLEYRIKQVAYLHDKLSDLGVPLLNPPGGHAVYVDAHKFMDHISIENFPGQTLVIALYLEGGVRAVEVGSLMLGKNAKHELVRLAIPRRVYNQSHLDYVAGTFEKVIKKKRKYCGYKIAWQPSALRHFTCKFEPV